MKSSERQDPVTSDGESGTKVTVHATDSETTERKSVSFSSLIKVYPPSPLLKEELGLLWYHRKEIATIKAECEVTVRAMISRKNLNTSDYTTRGLEHRTPEGNKKRLKLKLAALDAVLDEQEMQRKLCMSDEKRIAAVYQRYSVPRQEVAHQTGLRDQRCIQKKTSSKLAFSESYGFRRSVFQHKPHLKRNRRSSLPFM